MANKKLYITTPIYYSSGAPHIGHAFTTLTVDVFGRYKSLIGYDVYFLTGLDEHGQKIQEKAEENSMQPQEWCDYIAGKFLDLWKKLDIGNNIFIRTTDVQHVKAVQKIFSYYLEKGLSYLGEWKSLYCVGCEEPYTDSEAIKHEDGELYCRVGHKLITKSEPSYFFKMSQFNGWIDEYLKAHKDFIYPEARANEMFSSFINQGVEDLSISRTSVPWGIPILENPQHTVYVWLDALFNYVTALGFMSDDDSKFKEVWQDPETEIVHFMSKEITRFHCIYWPIFLNNIGCRLPNKIISHGWIVTPKGKMSKSFGNVINPLDLIDEFGSDAVRYYFAKESSFESDMVFSRELFINTYNNDLANIYGNLISRFNGLVNKYANGVISKGSSKDSNFTNELNIVKNNVIDGTEELINSYKVNELIYKVLELGKAANKYVEETKPWVLIKEGKEEEIKSFLFNLADSIRVFTILLAPILVKSTEKIKEHMNFSDEQLKYANIKKSDLLENHKLSARTSSIFPRFENNELDGD